MNMNLISRIDMNRQESHLNGIVFTVAYLPKYDKFTLVTMDNNIPLDLFEVWNEMEMDWSLGYFEYC